MLCFASGCWRQQVRPSPTVSDRPQLDAVAFTESVAQAMRDSDDAFEVKIEAPLKIVVQTPQGAYDCYLENVWRECQLNPSGRREVVQRHVETIQYAVASAGLSSTPNISDLVPLVKDRRWLDEMSRLGLEVYAEPLTGDLFVTYAENDPSQLRYLTADEFRALGLSPDQFRQLTLAQLSKALPQVTRHGSGPVYMLTAGGTFEASLVLFPEVWEEQQELVDGRIVVALPARDLLLFTGERSAEGLSRMLARVKEIQASESYLISDTLLVRTDDGWKTFVPTPASR